MQRTAAFHADALEQAPDLQLVERAQRGDGDALAGLYDAYVRRIYRYVALRLRDASEAEDLTEQVFMRMLESIGSFQPGRAPFSAWLFRIAHNLIVDYQRKQRSRARYVQLEAPLQRAEDPSEAAIVGIQMAAVREAIKTLPSSQQQVIALRFGGQQSIAEVAHVMSRSQAAVKSLQYKAIQTLRAVLDGQGGDRHERR